MMGSEQKRVSTIAFNWRIERRDGAGIALTSHDAALVRGGVTHRSDPGVVPATIVRSLGLDGDAGEMTGALSSAALTEADLLLGRWDGARVRLEAADWEDGDAAPVSLMGGELGEVALNGETFSVDLQGAASRLNESVCPTTSPECRAELGDRQCRVDLAGRSMRATIVATNGGELTLDRAVGDEFLFGGLRCMAGGNCGANSVILSVEGDKVRVRDLPRAEVVLGTAVELREGCDKRFVTCVERFENAANFRGEPHLPGNDLLTRYPGA